MVGHTVQIDWLAHPEEQVSYFGNKGAFHCSSDFFKGLERAAQAIRAGPVDEFQMEY